MVEYFQLTIEVSQGQHGDMTSLIYSTSAIILASLIILEYGKKFRSKIDHQKAADERN
jgi:hypothetical protein